MYDVCTPWCKPWEAMSMTLAPLVTSDALNVIVSTKTFPIHKDTSFILERESENSQRKRERGRERWNLWRWAFGHEWGRWWGVGEGIWGEWWWSQVREWAELICRWIWLRSLCPCSRLCLFHSDRLHRPPPLLCFVWSQGLWWVVIDSLPLSVSQGVSCPRA